MRAAERNDKDQRGRGLGWSVNKAVRSRFAMNEPWPEGLRRPARRLSLVIWLVLLIVLPCGGQLPTGNGQSSQRPMGPTPPLMLGDTVPGPNVDPVFQERRLRMLNVAQHKSMVDDTDKLLKLVNELNAEINRTNPSSLTPEELRKVAQIEKLARSVRDKMRLTVGVTPDFTDHSTLPPISASPR
jgi:hypothetical protein